MHLELKCIEGDVMLKEYVCVEVGHHKDIGKKIEEYKKNGWRLHTYQAAGIARAERTSN